jgi:ABC-type Fe3+-hydroxamate transport system substrate-binding protein
VVGITDYCIHPAEALTDLPRLGGPKTLHLDEIIALKPQLVLANQEENNPEEIQALRKAGLTVWLVFPKTVRQSMDFLWALADMYKNRLAALRLHTLEVALDWALAASGERQPKRCFCPIWQDTTPEGDLWWMSFNQDTYSHDLLRYAGAENIFAARERRYPLSADLGHIDPQPAEGRDTRYPRVTPQEVLDADPEVILLPDEPFVFEESHREHIIELLSPTSAVKHNRVHLLDGTLLAWYGTRLAHALQELPSLFD